MTARDERVEKELHYSGDKSVEFWRRVRNTDNMTLYIFGCALQELESRAWQALLEAEEKQTVQP